MTGGFSGMGGKNSAPPQSWELNESLTRPLLACGRNSELLRGPHQLGDGNHFDALREVGRGMFGGAVNLSAK
jgi:hypothetical protein